MAVQVELRQTGSERLMAVLDLPDAQAIPHPGGWFQVGEASFLVLQRHHRYRLRQGCYELAAVALQVKAQRQPTDARWWNHRWVIGDPSCRYNARTPLLRCAVWPEGPCERCSHYSPAP